MRHIAGLVLALIASPALAHIALWDPAMFGYDPNDPNQSQPVLPLMDLTFNEWWFHGYVDKPPAPNTFMILPSGGTYKGQVACNKALTSYGQNPHQQTGIYACDGDSNALGGVGAVHAADRFGDANPKDVKGCGLSIAYVSDEHQVQPEDFTVISTNYKCPWMKHVDFEIPSDLPPCPPEGCLCSWGWIHSIDGGSQQNYHLVYRCKVEGATGVTPIPRANTANKCDYPTDTSNCTVGAKQPHYWFQKERNNNPQGTYDPPFYNGAYGFQDGAQTDLFATVGGAKTDPAPVQSAAPIPSSAAESSASAVLPPASSIANSDSSTRPPASSSSVVSHTSSSSSLAGSTSQIPAEAAAEEVAPSITSPISVASTSTAVSPGRTSSVSSNAKVCRRRKRSLNNLPRSHRIVKRHPE